ncbi:MAG: T9SS type A sorting domain-containing protein, partial [Flavobacteriales bacterium]|nr:T9SS type A sorting domain-containing protein [Flavobacteriales bacterium]
FSSVGPHSKYGHWGAKVYENQLRVDAPKYDALLTFIENNEIWFPREPSLDDENDGIVKNDVRVYPIPSIDYLVIENPITSFFTIMLFDVTGNLVLQQEVNGGKVEISTSAFDKGVYFLSINSNENNEVIKILIQ